MSNRPINFNPLWIKLASDFKRDRVVKPNDVLELLSEEKDIPDVAREVLSALVQGTGKRKSDALTFQQQCQLIQDFFDLRRSFNIGECNEELAEKYKISTRQVEKILEKHSFLKKLGELEMEIDTKNKP
jgi:hypothetical protein